MECECVFAPPVDPGSTAGGAPRTNLSVRSGVPPDPSQSFHPVGIDTRLPDHITITPAGIPIPRTSQVAPLSLATAPVVELIQRAPGASGLFVGAAAW